MEFLEILKKCTVEGMVVRLPSGSLERKTYLEVAKHLEMIGGKWKGGRVKGFQFDYDPEPALSELVRESREAEKSDLKKEFQFFQTPDFLADELVELADIQSGESILEPSAGQGAIVKAIKRRHSNRILALELMDTNYTILEGISQYGFQSGRDNSRLIFFEAMKGDFLAESEKMKGCFGKIVANPPFSNNRDLKHIMAMYRCLKTGGRLVSLCSTHFLNSKNRLEMEFRGFLSNVDARVIDVPAGTFRESGTMVSSVILVIDGK